MPKSKAETILDNWGRFSTHRLMWEPVWQELAEYIQPRKSGILVRRTPGQRLTDKLFDSTGPHSNELLAASMQGSLTSSAVPWFGLRLRGMSFAQNHPVLVWLSICSEIMYDALRQSNFSAESHEVYSDLGCFGTGAMYEDENELQPGVKFAGLRFTAIQPGDYVIDEDAQGRVNLFYWKQEMSALGARDMFGEENLSPEVRKSLEPGNDAMTRFPFIHAVFRRRDAPPYDWRNPTTNSKKFPWQSCWVDEKGKKLMREGGYVEFPFFVPRWSKASGEIYGRGPGYTALPDIKTLNKAVELKLKALSKMVDPPLMVRDEGVIGNVRLTPGSLTHMRDMDAIKAMDLQIRLQEIDLEEDKLRQSIRRMFFSDQLQLQEGPQMTAFEVQVRFELMQRILGPTLGRLEREFLNPLIERTFWIMFRRGQFPQMPEELAQWLDDGNPLDIEYEGPLARTQRLSEVVATQRFFQILLPLVEARPEIMDIMKWDELVRKTALNTGVSPELLNSADEVTAMREARDQQNQDQIQLQQAGAQADAAGKSAPIVKALIEAQKAGILPQGGVVSAPGVG